MTASFLLRKMGANFRFVRNFVRNLCAIYCKRLQYAAID